jgi:hypothetical protein
VRVLWQSWSSAVLGENTISPQVHLAYVRRNVKTAAARRRGRRGIAEKRLYIFAGYDDYRIAAQD